MSDLRNFKWLAETAKKCEDGDSSLEKVKYEIIHLIFSQKSWCHVSVNEYSEEFREQMKREVENYGGECSIKSILLDGDEHILFRISFEWLKDIFG